jgi:response regulator RpfG family c-di-GMP phosphodiesterase
MEKKTNVLYVDDEESNLRIFRDSFRRVFNIFTALSGKEALRILSEEKIDVIITDQKMPSMTGVELLREVNLRYPEIPPNRLILSGYSEDEDIAKAFKEYNLSKFVSKPWEYEELKNIIENAIK